MSPGVRLILVIAGCLAYLPMGVALIPAFRRFDAKVYGPPAMFEHPTAIGFAVLFWPLILVSTVLMTPILIALFVVVRSLGLVVQRVVGPWEAER